jgi:hypothetical protein
VDSGKLSLIKVPKIRNDPVTQLVAAADSEQPGNGVNLRSQAVVAA